MSGRDSLFFCFCGPTASGKSTICKEISRAFPDVMLSTSTTTRSPRDGEKDGVDYFFVDEKEFEKRVTEKQFIEHARFSGFRYGTELANIERAKKENKDLLLDIEVQGVSQLKNLFPFQVVTVFVMPPSFSELELRLRNRRSETEEAIQKRLSRAKEEIEILLSPGYSNFLLINETREESIEQAKIIIKAERMKAQLLNSELRAKLLK